MKSTPNKYNEERVSEILQRLRSGCSQNKAAQYAGIRARSLYLWRKRYPHFDAAVREAIEYAETELRAALEKD